MSHKTLYFLFLSIVFTSCFYERHIKSTSYGKLIFHAYYDGLTGSDYLKLYDNDVFELAVSNVESNGTYQISGDTIFFDYFLYEGPLFQAYLMKQNRVFELEKRESNWVISKKGTDLGIYVKESQPFYTPPMIFNALILVKADSNLAKSFYATHCDTARLSLQIPHKQENHFWCSFPSTQSDSLASNLIIAYTIDNYMMLGYSFYGAGEVTQQQTNQIRAERLIKLLQTNYQTNTQLISVETYPYEGRSSILPLSKSSFLKRMNADTLSPRLYFP